MRYQALLAKRAELVAEGKTLEEKDTLTPEEQERFSAILADLDALKPQIEQAERFRDFERAAPAVRVVQEAEADPVDPNKLPTPFKRLGDQLAAAAVAAKNPHATPQGLIDLQAAALGLQEGVASDGGYLVQTDFTGALLEEVHNTGVLLGRTDRRPISANANGMRLNAVDETSRADGSRRGGVQAYWTAEAGSLTATKPKFRQMELTLQKLTGLYYATDEELRDTTNLAANVTRWFGEEFGFKIDDALLRGGGGGMPLGVIGHAGTVSISKEAGQAATTILKQNVEKMYARMPARSVPRAEWFINQDCWPQLFELSVAVGVGGVPLFIPSNSLANAPFGTLLGRPIVPLEQCDTLGTVGDIIFADWNEYITIEKGGIEAASSIHVQFLTDETAFRFILRLDGQPKRNATMTPFKGSANQSPFVTLATRS